MSLPGQCLPPTSSLPPARSLGTLSEAQISSALRNLHLLYCPLRLPPAFASHLEPKHLLHVPPPVDSGYASNNEEDDDDDKNADEALAALRADPFERNFAVRWLTAFIARADELQVGCEDARTRFIDAAAAVLASFNDPVEEDEDEGTTRDFAFALPPSAPGSNGNSNGAKIEVRLNDAPLSGTDHTDVGLQSWGASIILSDLMCSDPARFGLDPSSLLGHHPPPSTTTIVELGAGTGLVSLVLAKLLPHLSPVPTNAPAAVIVATDYHPAVLANLRANIATNFPPSSSSNDDDDDDDGPPPAPAVQACLLDWSAPLALDEPSSPLAAAAAPAKMLVAADVIYAREHAVWLRDCAARMLAPDGVFWLIATVRPTGRFEGITDTVEAAFDAAAEEEEEEEEDDTPRALSEDGRRRRLAILEMERLEKRAGVGRGDESGYKLYRIGWA